MGAKTGGWTGKFLRVDLTTGVIETQSSLDYERQFMGARGVAARLAWEEIPPGTKPFDPENRFYVGAGPLTGTSAPNSGRTTICSLSPQAYPYEWFSRSSIGGYWGPMLKYAGYDSVIISGRAPEPVYLWINDNHVELRPAKDLWGQGILATQRELAARHGPDVRSMAIGPAGENLVRIATIGTGTGSAAGQGGYGAVMGSKQLKAIAVHGTQGIPIARPDEYSECTLAIAKATEAACGCPRPLRLDPEMVCKFGQRFGACSQQCATGRCYISRAYRKVPGIVHPDREYSGQMVCVSGLLAGAPEIGYEWDVGFQAGFELAEISHDQGLNHWEIGIGMIPWLIRCQREGLLKDLDGQPFDLNSPHCWDTLFHKITYREGIGAALAEGAVRASHILGMGEDLISEYFTAWGFAAHWDGHGDRANVIVFPYWLVPALQWAMDTRDPMASGHGYAQNIMMWSPMRSPQDGLQWDEIARILGRVYGTSDAADPHSGYKGKAQPAVFEGHRSVMKDSLTVDDQMYPRFFSNSQPDHLARAGGMEGPSFEYHMFRLATGMDLSEVEFEQMAERVFNMERALQVRNWQRSRQIDEQVIPYFERAETWINPMLEEGRGLDRAQFGGLLDEYYALRGWDRQSGRPTRAKLEQLGLGGVADELNTLGLLP